MFQRIVTCDQCGELATVKTHTPIYEKAKQSGKIGQENILKAIRDTIDCPKCGVASQVAKPRSI